jgi:uncharacterized integral membrane protein
MPTNPYEPPNEHRARRSATLALLAGWMARLACLPVAIWLGMTTMDLALAFFFRTIPHPGMMAALLSVIAGGFVFFTVVGGALWIIKMCDPVASNTAKSP